MKNYRKKPVVIQAIQLENLEVDSLMALQHFAGLGNNKLLAVSDGVLISTLEGNMKASIGDFIIKGVQGEFYPCKPDIFEKTYDLADAPESFLDRVIKEKAELAEKTSKLKDFIENNPKFDELTNINRILLINQFNAMELYLYALDSRIEFIND
jgi:hypothetical protein